MNPLTKSMRAHQPSHVDFMSAKNTAARACWVVLTCTLAGAQASLPNFSGVWALDVSKSVFGKVVAPEAATLTITHDGPAIKIKSSQTDHKVQVTKEMNLSTDGTRTPNNVKMPGGTISRIEAVSAWSGQALVTTYRVPHVGHLDDYRDSWHLSTDLRTLTIVREVKSPDRVGQEHQYVMTLVYRRK